MASTNFVNGTVVQADWLNDVNDLVYNFTQTGSGAIARTAQSKMRDVVSVNDFGVVGDGVTDNTAAFNTAINAVGEGTTLLIKGICRIASTLLITKRVGFWCESSGDAILVDVGVANDGVVYSGTASGINNITLKLNVYGRANACRDAVVLSRVDRSPNIDINVYAGAIGYAVNLKGTLINKIKIDSSVNYQPPISSPGFQSKHVKIEKALGVAFNANDLYVDLEGGGAGITSDNMTSEGNNKIRGTIEGLTSGRPLDLVGWMGGNICDLHFEANAMGPRAFDCSHLTVGPNVINPSETTPFLFENCRMAAIDGYYGEYVFDTNCVAPKIGRVLALSQNNPDSGSYFASSEVSAGSVSISTADVTVGGPGSFTLENLFHNPFVDIWSNGPLLAPDGFTVVNGTVQWLTFPAPVYTSSGGKSCEVTVTTAVLGSGIFARCKEPNGTGQRSGHFMSAMVPIYVETGQPDVMVFIVASGQFFSIGRVTQKAQWIEVRGGARCSAGASIEVYAVPWNSGTNNPVTGRFIVGGMSIVHGVRAPRTLCDHGKRSEHIVANVSNAPAFVGQRAYVAGTGKWYFARNTTSSADWIILN